MEFYCEYILWFSFVADRVFIECFGCTSIFDVFTDVWSCTRTTHQNFESEEFWN